MDCGEGYNRSRFTSNRVKQLRLPTLRGKKAQPCGCDIWDPWHLSCLPPLRWQMAAAFQNGQSEKSRKSSPNVPCFPGKTASKPWSYPPLLIQRLKLLPDDIQHRTIGKSIDMEIVIQCEYLPNSPKFGNRDQ